MCQIYTAKSQKMVQLILKGQNILFRGFHDDWVHVPKSHGEQHFFIQRSSYPFHLLSFDQHHATELQWIKGQTPRYSTFHAMC